MNISKKLFCAAAIAALAASAAFAAYPTKQITVLQGFKAGGGSDTLAQLTQPYLEKVLGKSFVNQYIPGATGAIAWTQLAKATRKDGYTVSITNTPMLLTNYIMTPAITYNVDELTPIANVVTDPGIVVVAADSPLKTFDDFIEAVKANPGKVTVGNSGVGGDDFFTTLIFEKASGLKVQMVPFEGDGPSWQAAMGKKIDVSFNNIGIVFPQIKAGNLRALAIMAENRYELLPDVPTMREKGIDVVSGSSRGYSAPAGIPEEARTVLIEAFKKMAEMPEFKKACADRASIIDMKYGDEYQAMLKKQEKDFTEIWNEVKDQFQKH
ncbi:MAG: tripartite tricarboxylate transporter substrate binding protein [Pyramidobacter sp.]|nr:tripartite tricarboxylate transporter substrate binding protein [Pyramidobacter sp.]MBP3752613.1 tripartite tricarboxylate transporter substrate binding protein [Pyramidobacter sp.]